MATTSLSASAGFFKQLSLECQQLRLTTNLLEAFALRAKARGDELGDKRLLLILDQQEVFLANAKYLVECLEGLLWMVEITP